MLTEQEAKQRWCPKARYVIDAPLYAVAAGNRYQGDGPTATEANDACRCLASACMAWRKRPPEATGGGADPVPAEYAAMGFCGAFGEPK